MPRTKKSVLSVEEIKELLLFRARLSLERTKTVKNLLAEAFGLPLRKEDPISAIFESETNNLFADLMASRLKRNRHNVPILSRRDFDKLYPAVIESYKKISGQELDERELEFFKVIFGTLLEKYSSPCSEKDNPYTDFWQWAIIVVELAKEQGLKPLQFLEQEYVGDQITKRMFTQEEYLDLQKKGMDLLASNNSDFNDAVLQPFLLGLCNASGLSEEERQLEEKKLQVCVEDCMIKTRQVFMDWLNAEAQRIYG